MGRQDKRIAGLVLAAGMSTRMGAPKQLLKIDGRPLIERVVREALDSALDRVFLILGHRSAEVRKTLGRLLGHPRLEVVENPRYTGGISTSIVAGLSRAEEAYGHVMILLGDMPRIGARLINHLIDSYLYSGSSLGAVSVKGRRSHPVIFSRRHYPELHALEGDTGARPVFEAHVNEAFLLHIDYDDRDIDTPEDLSTL